MGREFSFPVRRDWQNVPQTFTALSRIQFIYSLKIQILFFQIHTSSPRLKTTAKPKISVIK